MFWPVLIILSLLSISLLALGLRGRRIDDHPICRRCRFDLVGIYPGREQCPECGKGISAIHIGNRRRRPRLLWIGGVLLIVSILLGAANGLIISHGIDTYPYRPLWLLRLEAGYANDDAAAAAVREITRRLVDDASSIRGLASLLDRALARQADDESEWDPMWGDLIEAAQGADLASIEQWERYLDQIVVLSVIPRSPVRIGDRVPYMIEPEFRVGTNRLFSIWLHAEPAIDSIRGTVEPNPEVKTRLPADAAAGWKTTIHTVVHRTPGNRPRYTIRPPQFHGESRTPLLFKWPTAQHRGTSEFRAFVDVRVFESSLPPQPGFAAPGGYLRHRTIEITAPIEVGGRDDAPPIRLLRDDETTRLVRTGATVPNGIQITRRPYTHVYAMVHFATMPTPVAFEVFLSDGDRQWFIGRMAADARAAGTGLGTSCVVPDLDLTLTTATLILRPSEDTARQTPDLWEIFGEEIVIENVPVTVR